MLRITADVFSGRPDPSWIVEDEAEARATLRDLQRDRQLLTDDAAPDAGLGLRGLRIEPLTDELAFDFDMTPSAYLRIGPQASGRAREIAERLIGSMMSHETRPAATHDALPLDAGLQAFLTGQLDRVSRTSTPDILEAAATAPVGLAEERASATAAVTCMIELGAFNPGFWNNDPNVRLHNNCYHYASNKRRDSCHVAPGGGQPGAGCGHMYTAITCPEVTRAALCDGLHRRFDCFPDSEKPRYLVALVVAPGPGFVDFHWYRRQKEGFWGHKPGSTAARNYDNRGPGHVINDPQTCDRGPYTQFCGYFYTCRSQRIV
jgi:hypothetical protein